MQDLPRHERRKILREEEKETRAGGEKKGKLVKWLVSLLVVVGILGGGYLLIRQSTKALPGEEAADKGREHVTDIYGVEYSSNPPSSGSHFPVWAKPGVYDRFISDGYLLHSMEHGYIVIWYDCSKPTAGYRLLTTEVYAHDEPTEESTDSGQLLKHMKVQPTATVSWVTPESPPPEEMPFPDSFKTEGCKSLISQLSEFTKVAKRVIVVPRQNLDTIVALTAWGRIEKLNKVDKEKIEEFIKAFHNKGPEATME